MNEIMRSNQNVMHLCCGRGGSLWAGEILGWRSIFALDVHEWRCRSLASEARDGWWPDLTVVCGDILSQEWYAEVHEKVDGIAAGFSCKDISSAGSGEGIRGGKTGPTYQGCLNAIDAFRPRWVFFENSPRIQGKGRDVVLANLRDRGYHARDGIIAASDVEAPHQRDRWFLYAHLAGSGCADDCLLNQQREENPQALRENERAAADSSCIRHQEAGLCSIQAAEQKETCSATYSDQDAADALRHRLQIAIQRNGLSEPGAKAIEAAAGYCKAYNWNSFDARLLRVVDGLADRGKRIEGLGDAWVPLQAAVAFELLRNQKLNHPSSMKGDKTCQMIY